MHYNNVHVLCNPREARSKLPGDRHPKDESADQEEHLGLVCLPADEEGSCDARQDGGLEHRLGLDVPHHEHGGESGGSGLVDCLRRSKRVPSEHVASVVALVDEDGLVGVHLERAAEAEDELHGLEDPLGAAATGVED